MWDGRVCVCERESDEREGVCEWRARGCVCVCVSSVKVTIGEDKEVFNLALESPLLCCRTSLLAGRSSPPPLLLAACALAPALAPAPPLAPPLPPLPALVPCACQLHLASLRKTPSQPALFLQCVCAMSQ